MGKKSASQRARKAERRARQQEAEAQPSNGSSTKSASADAAASSKSSAEAVDHSTSARGARMSKRRKSAAWRRRVRSSAIAIAIGVPALLLFAFIGGVFEPQLGVEASNEGGVGAHVGQGRELSQDNRPPSSGLHYPSATSYSISAQPVPAGNWLHNLEHGGIVILYRCADQQECGEAASLVRSEVVSRASDGAFGQVKIVGSPYQDMDTPWTAVAWRRTLPLEEFDAEQLLAFYERYVDRGPERAP